MQMSARPIRIHVVGCYRSGTTLMMELLWYGYEFSGRSEHEAPLFRPVPAGEQLYLTKKPPDTVRIDRVFQADEKLNVVAMVRDPRAVITSRHPDFPGVYFSGFSRWLEYQKVIERNSDHPRWLTLRYEDLLNNPASTQTRIEAKFSFLRRKRTFADFPTGAEVPKRAAISLNGIRPLEPGRVSAWRDHLPRVRAQLDAHPELQKQLELLGYETDTTWAQCLNGVTAHEQSYKDNPPHYLKALEARFRYWLKTERYLRQLSRWRAMDGVPRTMRSS